MHAPKLKLRGSTWHYAFTVAGERTRESTHCADRAGAEAVAAGAWFAALKRRGVAVPRQALKLDLVTLTACWLAELEDLAGEKADGFVQGYRADTRRMLKRFAELEHINAASFKAWSADLVKGGCSWRTVQHQAHTVRTFLRWCVGAGHLDLAPEIKGPTRKLVAKSQAPRRAMKPGERDRFLRHLVKTKRLRAHRIYTVMFWSALRMGELEALTPRWLDRRARLIRLPPDHTKSGLVEEVYLDPRVARAIRQELAAREGAGKGPGSVLELDRPVFGPFDCSRAFWSAVRELKLDATGLTAHHVARHTACTLAADRTRDVRALQAVGRWKSLEMVQKYLHPDARLSRVLGRL